MVATKKGDIIEYQPHSTQSAGIGYDNYEEPDFDYVVEDLSHTLVETKSDSTEIHNPLQLQDDVYQDMDDDDGDGDQSQTDYEHGFQNFSMQRNDSTTSGNSQNMKNELTTNNMGITSTIGSNVAEDDDNNLILPDGRYSEYHNEASTGDSDVVLHDNGTLAATQWCLKTSQMPKNLTLQETKSASMSSGINLSTHDVASSSTSKHQDSGLKITTKFVRDVKTMTSNKSHNINGQSGKVSESSEIIAKSWAIQYEELTPDQKVLARKAINDILFEGCMGHLTMGVNGRVTNCNPTNYKNQKMSKNTSLHDEVESGEIYQQATANTAAGLSSNVTVVSKSPDEWLKL